ncbi:MAG: thermonuclease family protein [Gammaproteobacteria bacterium]|nr:thermonuclease family protein [Gammaproteobacteria bacterium]
MVFPKRTLLAASFFYAWQLIASSVQATECRLEHYDEQVTVAKVHDGDTVRLADGRNLRFIAINTPERARNTRPAQPLAEAGKQRLEALLAADKTLRLRYDEERKDRHGRLLAHPFLSDGRNLTQQLLQAGLGFHITVPPNLLLLECYQQAELDAQRQQRGLWQRADYRPRQASQLGADESGFMRVTGTVSRIGESRSAYWLNLGRGFALRLPKADIGYFPFPPGSLKNKTLTVRGWIYSHRGELRMNLRHPASIEKIADNEASN